jgi:ketopantoate reductase
MGLNAYGILYGHSLGQLEARPPLTYIVPDNWCVLQLAVLNGEVEVIEGDDHYTTDGFDVEACEPLPLSALYEFPNTKHLWLNTLTIPAKTKFNIKTEPQPEESWAPYRGENKKFGSVVKFNNDPSILGYRSDQNLVVESNPIPRKITITDVVLMDNERAKKSLGAIKHLICAVDSQSVVSALLTVKDRLRPDSTILFTQKGMNIMETVNEQVFPDPKTRPTYIPSIFSHAVWKSDNAPTTLDILSDEIEKRISGAARRVHSSTLTVKHGAFGSLLLGPVAPVEGETVKQAAQRQKGANYFVSALLAAPWLRTRCVSAELLLQFRLRDTVIASVIGPTSIRYNCLNGCILGNEERIAHVSSPLREAA